MGGSAASAGSAARPRGSPGLGGSAAPAGSAVCPGGPRAWGGSAAPAGSAARPRRSPGLGGSAVSRRRWRSWSLSAGRVHTGMPTSQLIPSLHRDHQEAGFLFFCFGRLYSLWTAHGDRSGRLAGVDGGKEQSPGWSPGLGPFRPWDPAPGRLFLGLRAACRLAPFCRWKSEAQGWESCPQEFSQVTLSCPPPRSGERSLGPMVSSWDHQPQMLCGPAVCWQSRQAEDLVEKGTGTRFQSWRVARTADSPAAGPVRAPWGRSPGPWGWGHNVVGEGLPQRSDLKIDIFNRFIYLKGRQRSAGSLRTCLRQLGLGLHGAPTWTVTCCLRGAQGK